MSNSDWYQIAGLVVRSAVPLPAWPVAERTPQVRIRFGSVPTDLVGPTARGPSWESTARRLLLDLGDAGRCLVQNGDEIIVHLTGATTVDVSQALLGTAMGAVCHQRGLLPLHASTVATAAGCMAFAGSRGAGKSTLAAFLARRGFGLLGDDICPISLSDQARPMALPWIPRVRLRADAAAALDVEGEEDVADKHPWMSPDQFCPDPLPLRRIYVLDPTASSEPTFTRLRGIDALHLVDRNTYRRRIVLEAMGQTEAHFLACAAVARSVPVFRMSSPRGLERLGESLEALQEHWR